MLSSIKRDLFLIVFLFCFSTAFCEDAKAENEKKEPAKEVADSVKKVPPAPSGPPWWTNSAMVQFDNKFKVHFEGELKYTYQTGTLDSHLIEGTGMVAMRKNRFTNFFFSDVGFMNAKQHFAYYKDTNMDGKEEKIEGSTKIFLRKYQVVDVFRTDLSKNLFFDLGWEWYRDDISFIQNRSTYFSGIGYQFDVDKKHHFSFIGGLGYEETEYTPRDVLVARQIPLTVLIEDTPDSMAGYFQYKGSQQLNPMISFHQSFFYTYYLDQKRNDRWELKLRVMFKLNQSLFLFTAYESTYENNKTSNASGGEKLNSKLVTGIKFSF